VDKAFEAVYRGDCNTDIKIVSINDKGQLVNATDSGIISIRNGKNVLWGYGAKHTWIGKLTYAGYTFDSDANNPLQFMVDKYKGYIYIKGKGKVTQPDRNVIIFP
jgi:hypothetical protein